MKLVSSFPERQNITIELTPHDQDVLYTITNRIGGDPKGPRGVTDALGDILCKAQARDVHVVEERLRAIYFKDDLSF